MTLLRRILVATDYSVWSSHAETRAAMLAANLKVDALELMAMNPTRLGLGSEAVSSKFVTVNPRDLVKIAGVNQYSPYLRQIIDGEQGSNHVIKEGDFSNAVFARAKETFAGITVVPLKRNNLFADLLQRSHPADSLDYAERPTLVVRNPPADHYGRVLIATDFSEASRHAAQVALQMCPSAHFTFLHVCDIPEELEKQVATSSDILIPSYKAQEGEAARRKLNRFIDELKPRTQLIFRTVLYRSARAAILQYAKQMQAELIVVGKRGTACPEMPFDSSVGHYLIRKSNYDLLIADVDPATSFDNRIGA